MMRRYASKILRVAPLAFLAMALALPPINTGSAYAETSSSADAARLNDASGGKDWAAYGRTYGEQHYSPLTQINTTNVKQLGLAWSMDLGPGNPATLPVAVDGKLYFASGLAVVHAVDAASGKLLWTYDPQAAQAAGHKLREGWGPRGVGYWNGKVYVGTPDGRLIAIDAQTGKPVWSALTVNKNDGRFITGAPRLFDGKVIIGHGGGDSADIRGYVTTYDAETGKQLWRFFLVPGEPAKGFEDKAQEMAAKTWAGQWWKFGGGGNAWNAFTYDPETDTVFVGTGNGAPWNRKIRSLDKGDNLFLCSIVALDAKTGAYKWHYQINPGESWDYNATMDMQLADLTIAGQPRKVLMQAPKNGFLYVIDRVTGKLISAEKIAKVTWATKIDLVTGRPVEDPGARYPNGKDFEIWPSQVGAHSWMPSAYSPETRLLYIPLIERSDIFNDRGIDIAHWKRMPGDAGDIGANVESHSKDPLYSTGWLLAIDPASQQVKWKLKHKGMWNGGLMATAGNLVFQGQTTGEFDAYAADTGAKLWSSMVQAPVVAAPITYEANGVQYVTLLVGMGTSATMYGPINPMAVDYRTQAKRVLTFIVGGKATLPPAPTVKLVAAADPGYHADPATEAKGFNQFIHRCAVCHGFGAYSGGAAPDLRMSPIPTSADAFKDVVKGGALLSNGMPKFEELTDSDVAAIRQYVRSRAAELRATGE